MLVCARRRWPRSPAEIAKSKARLDYAQAQLDRTAYLARTDTASQQGLDQAENDVARRAQIVEAEANHAAAQAGPNSGGARHRRRAGQGGGLRARGARAADKTVLRAPADGGVSVIVTEVGENVRAGQPVLAIEEPDKRWLSFNAREDLLHGSGSEDGRRRQAGPLQAPGGRHRAAAARAVRDLAGRARGRRS